MLPAPFMPKTMLERVLVPLDGSSQAETLLPLLGPLLGPSGSEVFFVRALPPAQPPGTAPFEEADGYVRAIADRFQKDGLCAHALVSVGAPHQVIESLACEEEITLVVMPAQADAAPGPVLERLLRETRRPLVALRPATGLRAGNSERSILVPLDGSEASRRSLPLAAPLAQALRARVILLRVLAPPSERLEALGDLREIAGHLGRQGVAAEVWIESGDPAERILQAASDPGVLLVAISTQGHSGGAQRLLGDVTRQVLSRSPIPVLAVHVREGLPV
jgi:nucleotide-binding universal stress UspA family protein